MSNLNFAVIDKQPILNQPAPVQKQINWMDVGGWTCAVTSLALFSLSLVVTFIQ